MKKLSLFLLLSFPFINLAQHAERSPSKTVHADRQSKTNGDVIISEGHRQITIHPDDSKTIIVKATQVSPERYISSEAEENTSDLGAMNWTKEDLVIYIKSLELKKSNVESDPEQHTKALENGWYEFIDRMILESQAILESLK